MLQYQTVSPDTLELLKRIMTIPELDKFCLVGGTSLALQTGHRLSDDLDFFTEKTFDKDSLQKKLSNEFSSFELLRVSPTGFTSRILNVKCDFFNWSAPLINPPLMENGIRLCSLEDIAAFKPDAIVTRKEKKDFWDIEVLEQKLGFEKLLQCHRMKFPYMDLKVTLDALSAIAEADKSEEPRIVIWKTWETVKKNIREKWK